MDDTDQRVDMEEAGVGRDNMPQGDQLEVLEDQLDGMGHEDPVVDRPLVDMVPVDLRDNHMHLGVPVDVLDMGRGRTLVEPLYANQCWQRGVDIQAGAATNHHHYTKDGAVHGGRMEKHKGLEYEDSVGPYVDLGHESRVPMDLVVLGGWVCFYPRCPPHSLDVG